MKKLLTRQAAAVITLFLLLLAVSASQALAQNADEAPQAEEGRGNRDANWANALGLTPDQVARIRAIRQQNRFEWQAARQRVNQAQRALDQAIYSDDVNEAVIEQRAREVAEAQAIEVRLRAQMELSIRRVLTPEQLNTFRMVRQQRTRAAEIRRRLKNRRPLGDRFLENGTNQASPLDRNEGRPADGGQGGRDADSLLGPRRRRGGLRRISP